MLYPYETSTREVRNLDGVWKFCPDPEGIGEKEQWQILGLPESIPMPVPSSYNDITTDKDIRDLIGDAWYEKTTIIPKSWLGKRVVLRFGSVTHSGKVWVNGQYLMEHKGGYLPFEQEIQNMVPLGEEVRITVKVNNVLDYQTLPPGEVEILEDEYRYEKPIKIQNYFHDFYNYAGIHRPVKLYTTSLSYVSDLTIETNIQKNIGIIKYQTENVGQGKIRIEIKDKDRKCVGVASGKTGEIRIQDAHLWEPGNPYLYQICVILENDGEILDIYQQKIGIRTVVVDEKCFYINGKPFYFKGFGKHEDMDIKGKGLDLALWVKDFNLMKWLGANSFRTSHYPYAEEILDLADEYGFVVIDESPAVGMTFFNQNKEMFVQERVNLETQKHHIEIMKELIQRDKNHPCVVMWSVANEPASWEKRAREYFEKIVQTVRECDKTRPVTMVSCAFPYGEKQDTVADLLDVICVNKYYSWYEDSGMLDVIEYQVYKEFQLWHERYKKPVMITEYGADAIAGFHSVPSVMFTEEYQIEMIEHFNKVLDQFDFVIGEQLWAFADFATKQGTTRVVGNKKGIFTRERNPKSIAFYLLKRWKERC